MLVERIPVNGQEAMGGLKQRFQDVINDPASRVASERTNSLTTVRAITYEVRASP